MENTRVIKTTPLIPKKTSICVYAESEKDAQFVLNASTLKDQAEIFYDENISKVFSKALSEKGAIIVLFINKEEQKNFIEQSMKKFQEFGVFDSYPSLVVNLTSTKIGESFICPVINELSQASVLKFLLTHLSLVGLDAETETHASEIEVVKNNKKALLNLLPQSEKSPEEKVLINGKSYNLPKPRKKNPSLVLLSKELSPLDKEHLTIVATSLVRMKFDPLTKEEALFKALSQYLKKSFKTGVGLFVSSSQKLYWLKTESSEINFISIDEKQMKEWKLDPSSAETPFGTPTSPLSNKDLRWKWDSAGTVCAFVMDCNDHKKILAPSQVLNMFLVLRGIGHEK